MSIVPFNHQTRAFTTPELSISELAELKKLPWHYGVPFSDIQRVPGPHDPVFRLHEYLFDRLSFNNKSVLHIGCRDGLFLFLAESLGSSLVRGIDDAPAERRFGSCFTAAKELLGAKSQILNANPEFLTPEIHGSYDLVILSDALTTSECPKRILESACKVSSSELLLVTHCSKDEGPLPILTAYRSYSDKKEFRDLYAPNLCWIRNELETNGFELVEGVRWEARDVVALKARKVRFPKKLSWDDLPLDVGSEEATAVLVVSCNKYHQAWDPFFTLLFKYWPDCPYKIYFLTDTGTYNDPRVTPIEIGKDLGWAGNFKYALERISASRIILTLEDFFPTAPWNNQRIRKLVRHAHDVDAGVVRCYACPGPSGDWFASEAVGTIGATDDYRISTMNSIWKKSMLSDLIQDGMNAWQFELQGSRNAATRMEPFLSVWGKDPQVMPYYATGITKGVWEPEAIDLLKREGIPTEGIRMKV